jgi:hypothetical protein
MPCLHAQVKSLTSAMPQLQPTSTWKTCDVSCGGDDTGSSRDRVSARLRDEVACRIDCSSKVKIKTKTWFQEQIHIPAAWERVPQRLWQLSTRAAAGNAVKLRLRHCDVNVRKSRGCESRLDQHYDLQRGNHVAVLVFPCDSLAQPHEQKWRKHSG